MNQWIELSRDMLGIAATAFGTVWFNKWLEKRYKSKNLNLDEDFKKKRNILPILEAIRYELSADRAFNMAFSNGDVTLTGYHLKKISVLMEANSDGVRTLAQDFQLIPTKFFENTLDNLYESPYNYKVFQATEDNEELAVLHSQYKISTLLMVKIKNDFGKWVGIVSVGFTEPKELTDGEISFVELQASKLGQLK